MVRGVKKIKCVGGLVYKEKSNPNSLWVIKPDQYVYFAVSEWHPATTAADKSKDITWIRQSADRKTIIKQMLVPANQKYGLMIPRKLCGNFSYYVEASLSGNRDKANTGLFVRGFCPPLILSSKWSTQSGGSNIKNQAGIIKYGHVVHLNLQTEGLNNNVLTIEVYNRIGLNRADNLVGIYTGAKVIDGEIDLKIGNTFAWIAKIKNISNDEDFYIKVKDPATNKYVLDGLNQDLHAVYLKIRNEVATTAIEPTRNNKVAKVGQAQTNAVKYDPCKFNKIEISEIIKENGLAKPQTTVLFNEGTSGNGSQAFSVVAPDQFTGKELILVVEGFDTQKCQTKKHISKEVIFREVGVQVGNDDKRILTKGQSTIKQKVYSNITRANAITYIWAKATTPNQFWYYINSCRYYSEPTMPTVIIKAYPDVKWELAVEFQVGVSNYKAANMPAGNVYARHQDMARQQGYKRWLMNQQSKVPINIGLGLSAEWNEGNTKVSYTQQLEGKIGRFVEIISKSIDTLQEAVNFAQSAAKATSIPIGFDIRYPKLTIAASWSLDPTSANQPIAVVGVLNVAANPLIGGSGIIDILGCAIAAASYGTTGNPAAARLIEKFRGGLEKLGASVVFTATFYGELLISFDALKIHSIKGIGMADKATIGGKMGVTIELSISVEIGRIKGTKTKPLITFKAAGKADAYFGGEFLFNSDSQGLFAQPVIKFSGVVLSLEVEGEAGWWKSSFKIEEKVINEQTHYFEKKYLN
ncbi:hypothetical protein [Pedobacter mendelii]|uniref:Uncharacterized protein n=1 Tax=Pedobacter mendelii TaxID=1908240 RepID=A0ABQ2BPE9_9SPHI|nr:hypothetical protein [Pedobacter mendelii]GGI29478.1 hypothetical protein GCM10008119_37830 [Pedobacter mendelii]